MPTFDGLTIHRPDLFAMPIDSSTALTMTQEMDSGFRIQFYF
jgi:hypothetical protein